MALTSTDWSQTAVYERRHELGDVRTCVSVAAVESSPLPDAVCHAMPDPANDVLRHLTMALLYRPASGRATELWLLWRRDAKQRRSATSWESALRCFHVAERLSSDDCLQT